MPIRVLIVDDHHVVRAGLRTFLERDQELEVVDEASNGAEAIEKARYWLPNVVLMDLLLPGVDGVAATTTIRQELPGTQVVALSGMIGYASVSSALRAGAIGYLAKDTHPSELRAAIKAAAAGRVQLSPSASTILLDALGAPEGPESLTEREKDVLDLLALGKANKDIAQHLHVTEDTVKTHVRHILAKLKVQSRTQAILTAFRLGLVARDPGVALPLQ